ncbi:pilus assembly protein PilM [bacterium]|nr:pilus assembly protein PilM [bacterium]
MDIFNFSFASPKRWKRVLGVEFGNESLQYVLLNRMIGKYVVENFGKYAFKGVGDPIEGLYTVLPLLFKKHSHLKSAKLIIGLDESVAVVKTDSFPPLQEKELRQTISLAFQKEMGAGEDGNPIVFGYYPMGPDPDNKANTQYLIVGMYEDEINQIIQPFSDQGLIPEKIVVRMMALGNIAALLPGGRNNVPMGILNIGNKKSMLAIFRNGKLDFHREIVMGDEDFTKAIIGTIFHEGKAIQFSLEEAAEFKNKFGYPLGFVDSMSFKGAPLSELGAMMRPVVERLTGEIQRSIGFYADKTKGQAVTSLYLVGKGAKIKHLDQVLNSRVGVPVARLPIPKNVTVAGGKKQKTVFKQKFLDHSISLAVASEMSFTGSLLPDYYRERRLQNMVQKAGLVVGGILAGIALILVAWVYTNKGTLKNKIVHAEKLALAAETSEKKYARAITQNGLLTKEIDDIKMRISQDEDLVQVLRLFSHELPKELLMSTFHYTWEMPKKSTPTPAERRQKKTPEQIEAEQAAMKPIRKVIFEGGTTDPDADVKIAVADFLISLQASGYFERVELTDELMQEGKDAQDTENRIYWFQAEGELRE